MTNDRKHPPHVLLVEDTPFDVRVFRRGLSRSDQPVRLSIAGNGEEALRMLEEAGDDPPDIAVVDLNMPRLSGHEFIEALRSRPWPHAGLPVIVYTTSDLPTDRRRCAARGVHDYVVKTAPVGQVLDLVTERLSRQEPGRT